MRVRVRVCGKGMRMCVCVCVCVYVRMYIRGWVRVLCNIEELSSAHVHVSTSSVQSYIYLMNAGHYLSMKAADVYWYVVEG